MPPTVTLAGVLAIGQLAEAGVSTEIARRVATAHGHGDSEGMRRSVRQGTTVLVGIAGLLEITGVVVAHPVVNLVFTKSPASQREQLVWVLIGLTTLVAIGLVGNGYFGILTGLQRTDYQNWSGIASLLVSAGVTVGGIALGFGIWALLLAAYVQLLVGWIGPAIGLRRVVPDMRFRLTKVSPNVVLGFIGMPAMIVFASASTLFDMQFDKLVLTRTVGPSPSAMFQIGAQVVLSAKTVALIPLAILLAGTAELYRTNPGRLRRLEKLAGSTAQAIAAVTAGGFLIFSSSFVRVWLGPGYGGGGSVDALAGHRRAAERVVRPLVLLRGRERPISLRGLVSQRKSGRQRGRDDLPHNPYRAPRRPDRFNRRQRGGESGRLANIASLGTSSLVAAGVQGHWGGGHGGRAPAGNREPYPRILDRTGRLGGRVSRHLWHHAPRDTLRPRDHWPESQRPPSCRVAGGMIDPSTTLSPLRAELKHRPPPSGKPPH